MATFANDCRFKITGLSFYGITPTQLNVRPELRTYPSTLRAFSAKLQKMSNADLDKLKDDLEKFRLPSLALRSLGLALEKTTRKNPTIGTIRAALPQAKILAAKEIYEIIRHTDDAVTAEDAFNELQPLTEDPESAVVAVSVLLDLYQSAPPDLKQFALLRLQRAYLYNQIRIGRFRSPEANSNLAEAARLVEDSSVVSEIVASSAKALQIMAKVFGGQIDDPARSKLFALVENPPTISEEEARAVFMALSPHDYDLMKQIPAIHPLDEGTRPEIYPFSFFLGLELDETIRTNTLTLAAQILEFHKIMDAQSKFPVQQELGSEFINRYHIRLADIRRTKPGSITPTRLMDDEHYRTYVFDEARISIRDEKSSDLEALSQLKVLTRDQILSLIDLARNVKFQQLPSEWLENEAEIRKAQQKRLAETFPSPRAFNRFTAVRQIELLQELSKAHTDEPDFTRWMLSLVENQSLKKEVQSLVILVLLKISDQKSGEQKIRDGQWFLPQSEEAPSIVSIGLGDILASVMLPLDIQEELARHFSYHVNLPQSVAKHRAEEFLARMAVSPKISTPIRRFAKTALENLSPLSNWLPLPTAIDLQIEAETASKAKFNSIASYQEEKLQKFIAVATLEANTLNPDEMRRILKIVRTTQSENLKQLFELRSVVRSLIENPKTSSIDLYEILEATEAAIERGYNLTSRLFRIAKGREMAAHEMKLIQYGADPLLAHFAARVLHEALLNERDQGTSLRLARIMYEVADRTRHQEVRSGFQTILLKQARVLIHDSLSSFLLGQEAEHLQTRVDEWKASFGTSVPPEIEIVSKMLNPNIEAPLPLLRAKEALAMIKAQAASQKYQSQYQLPPSLEIWVSSPSVKARDRALRLITGFKLLMEAVYHFSGFRAERFGADSVLVEYRAILKRLSSSEE